MKQQTYQAPQVEVIEVQIEQGFALSNSEVGGRGNDFPLS